MRISKRQLEPTPSKEFSRRTDESVFKHRRHCSIHSTTVYFLQRPVSLSAHYYSNRPLIIAAIECGLKLQPRHPLTLKPHLKNIPKNFDLAKLHPSILAVSHHAASSFDKLLIVPTPILKSHSYDNHTLLALYDGGQLRGCLPYLAGEEAGSSPWVKLSRSGSFDKFDDITIYNSKVYALDRLGKVYMINNYAKSRKLSIGKTLINRPVTPESGLWRKRLVVDGKQLYLVVRTAEKGFEVYKLVRRGKAVNWAHIKEFDGKKVLFMARDYCFFTWASSKFPGREFKNCIVFSEGAFPKYGNGCWELTSLAKQTHKSEETIAIFRLADQTFAKGAGNSDFPNINWLPPDWALQCPAAETFREHHIAVPIPRRSSGSGVGRPSQSNYSSDSHSKSIREPDEDEVLSGSGSEKDREVQSDLKDSNSQEDEQKGMESDSVSQDEEHEELESDSDSQDQEDAKMQCDSNSQENEDGEMHCNVDIEGGSSLQGDVSPSLSGPESRTTDTGMAPLSADEEVTRTLLSMNRGNGLTKEADEEVTRALLCMNRGNGVTKEDTSRENINIIQSIPRACTSYTTKVHTSDSETTKFEGFNIRSDLVPILHKIWQKHGNVIENSIIRSGDIVARALESLATMVQILENNSAQSLSDHQADYLSSTLSDLRCMCFKVYWLVSFVDKAAQLHKSKPLVDSLKNLSQLSSQVKERRAVLLDELAKLDEEENKLKEEMLSVSKMIPLYGQAAFNESLGLGLT